ncbi:sensor histidine kinase [Flavobacterium aquatile]|uniref:sensor histidine kinase n=1 Tax=Flavobacterium aquatile TaxID=245 RepID=UPI001039515F|nr:HAMP domain-containing sensor histidine kinase [Flavobacterium aquatile]
MIIFIIVLQCLVLYFWYIETENDNKLRNLSTDVTIANDGAYYTTKSYSKLNKSQVFLQDFIKNKNKKSLLKYYESLDGLNSYLDSLDIVLKKGEKSMEEIYFLKQNLDSVLSSKIFMISKKDESTYNRFNYDGILNSVNVDSIVTKDSVARKGLFSRLGDAIFNKKNIQKEKLKIIISYKYQNKLRTGEIKNEIENILKTSDKFYSDNMKKLEDAYYISDKNNLKLYKLNAKLLESSINLIDLFNNSLNSLKNKNNDNFTEITKKYLKQRNYIIFLLTLLMLLFSIILYRFTRLAFQLENKLVTSKKIILNNLEYKNKIIGMISHEIRSPLSIISIYSKMVSSKVDDKEVKEVFKSIEYTTSTLLLLSGQILEYSKNENKKMELINTQFNLNDVLVKIVDPLTPLALTKGNKLRVEKNISKQFIVLSDPTKISQLFYNLVGNAIKFTENGTISIEIFSNKVSSKKINLLIEVNDSGVGISEDELKNIFEDFYQGSNGFNNVGVGLGLKICKEIVELFGGTIEVESQYGAGTKVKLNLFMNLIDS